jgi:hypothetical protein
VYLGACLIAGIRLAREEQVNVRVVPTGKAIGESVDLAYDIYNRVFRKVPNRVNGESAMCGQYGRRADKQPIAEWMQAHDTGVFDESYYSPRSCYC